MHESEQPVNEKINFSEPGYTEYSLRVAKEVSDKIDKLLSQTDITEE